MSNVVVFTGPTLRAAEVLAHLPDAEVRPPAALGDVYRAMQSRPRVIALIDGLFERVPSPWHKELLWAMHEGVTLFGAASMGALRAAELEPFGMIGVGRVYDWFRSGELEDDDEVAVAHRSAEHDFRAVSDAMVNIRGTLERAVDDDIVSQPGASSLCAIAKALHYTDRTWPGVVHHTRSSGVLAAAELGDFERWLVDGRVDVKADDARSLLATMSQWSGQPGSSARPASRSWSFEHTTFWEHALQEITSDRPDTAEASMGSEMERVLDELALRPEEHREIFDEAFVIWLAGACAQARSLELRPDETQAVLDEIRLDMGLLEPADVEAWLADEEMDLSDLRALVREEATLAWARTKAQLELAPLAVDVLRRRRRYGALLQRARDKHAQLGTTASDRPTGPDDDADLLHWWFVEVQGQPVPDHLDAYLIEHRLGDRSTFTQALHRERWYRSQR